MANSKIIQKIAVIGLGYVGLPTMVAIAKTNKFNVVGYDISLDKIKSIKQGLSPIEDPEVQKYLDSNKLQVSTKKSILKGSKIFIICVPTPIDEDYQPDYSIVKSATSLVGEFLQSGNHVVLESTVNPGTSDEILIPLLQKKTKMKSEKDFNFAHCPERINPGDNHWNIYNINRNIGSSNKKMSSEIANFYRSFITEADIHEVSSIKVAEATKIVENTFRDINIAYVNELAKSFDAMEINLHETLQGAANKPFGFMPHWPGAGVGGHCIAVDPYYLIRRAAKSGFDHKFLKLAREINESMPYYVIEKLTLALNESGQPIRGTRITLLGLSYKPNIGDIRESPALVIAAKLKDLGADLKIYDPYTNYYPGNSNSLKSALTNTQAVVVATAHQDFITQLPKLLLNSDVKVVIDGRNCLDTKDIDKKIIYKGIGKSRI